MSGQLVSGFLSVFCPRGGKMGLNGFFGGQAHTRVQACGKLGVGPGACSPWEILILELLLDAIWWNLGLFSHKQNLSFIVSLKPLYN